MVKENKTCLVEDCNQKYYALGYCNKHYAEFKTHREIRKKKGKESKCIIEGCNNTNIKAKELCEKHYTQLWRHGKILERTSRDLNEIIVYENYAEIILYNKEYEEYKRTLIDVEDINKCKKYKWSFNGNYVSSRNGNLLLHRYIMNCNDEKYIDHINKNKLDNRKCNLRICTNQENSFNKNINLRTKSGLMGVFWSNRYKKWEIQISIDGKNIYITRTKNINEAIAIRLKAEDIVFKEFAPNKDLYHLLNNYEIIKNVKSIEELKNIYKKRVNKNVK